MVVFEALNALWGDCFVLRYSDALDHGRVWIIDGGPRAETVGGKVVSVWRDVLLPRLREIDPSYPFVVDLGIVSHIDDDHVTGIERLAAELVASKHQASVKFRRFWFNSFDELVGPAPAGLGESSGAIALQVSNPAAGLLLDGTLGEEGDAVVQGVPVGIKLAAHLRSLSLRGNAPFDGFIAAKPGQARVEIDGAMVTILGPQQDRLERLRGAWRAGLAGRTKTARAAALESLFAADSQLDFSVPNLSSIVVLVEISGRRMLLTGDARGDDIVASWQQLELPDSARALDLLKVPHHGRLANNPESFVRFFSANHYVFSADGRHDDPDPSVLECIVSTHGERPMTLHFTNTDIAWSKPYRLRRGSATVCSLLEMLDALRASYPGPWTWNLRPTDRHSIEIPL